MWISKSKRNQWLLHIGLAILILLLLTISVCFILKQEINFDEAIYLQAPSSLVKHGSYSTYYHGSKPIPWFSTGPTVLLPIWLTFTVFGIGIYQARIIMLIYFSLMIISAFLVSYRLFGIASAITTTVLILILPQAFFFGLIVLGEVPATFYFLLAVMLLTKGKPLFSGFLMGLAVLTKFIFFLSIFPLFLLFGLEFFLSPFAHKKQIPIFYCYIALGALLPNLIWEALKFLSLGLVGYEERIRHFLGLLTVHTGLKNSVFAPIYNSIEILSYPFDRIPSFIVLALLVLAILHNLLAVMKHLKKACEWINQDRSKLFLTLFAISSLVWWLSGLHNGWWKRLFPFYIVILLPVGNSLISLVKTASSSISKLAVLENWRSAFLHLAIFITTSYLFIFAFVLPAQAQIDSIKASLSSEMLRSQFQLAAEVSEITQKDGIIAYWGSWQSPEISFLTRTQFWNVEVSKTRDMVNDLAKQGKDVFVLVSPTQKIIEPQAWSDENIFCGKLIIENAGYELFEYVPSYDWTNQYRFLIERGDIATLPSAFNLNDHNTPSGYYEGIYWDGWIARKAIIWLSNDPMHTKLIIEGSVNLDYYDQEPISVHVSIMDTRVAEPVLSHSGDFEWVMDLPNQSKAYDALRITIESSNSFVPKDIGINQDLRELGLVIRRIELRE